MWQICFISPPLLQVHHPDVDVHSKRDKDKRDENNTKEEQQKMRELS